MNAPSLRGTYIGHTKGLRGEQALLRRGSDGALLAQFNDMALGSVAFGWTEFDEEEFYIHPPVDWS